MDNIRSAPIESLSEMMLGDPNQMLDLFKSLVIGGLPANQIQEALQAYKPEFTSEAAAKKVPFVSPWKAINATQQVTTQNVEETLNLGIAPRSPFAVSTAGTYIYMKQFWAGALTGLFGEISQGTVIPLPGSAGYEQPGVAAQLVLGPGSQVGPNGSFSTSELYGGLWGIPALTVPPPGADLPPYSDPAWNQGQPTLIKPVSIEPWIPLDTASAFNAVMVRYNGPMQPKRSFFLSREYTMGRMVVANGRLGLNSNSTQLNTSGSATIAQVQSFRLIGITQAGLKAQGGGKAATTDWLGSTIGANRVQGGVRFTQATQVLEELQPVDYARVSGNQLGGKAEPFDRVYLPASGISGGYLEGSVYQASTPAQPGQPGPFKNNNIYDRLTGAFMEGRFYSDRFKVNFQFAQSPKQDIQSCRVGDYICNTYLQNVLDSNNCNKFGTVVNKQIPASDELFLPTYILTWNIGMGSARSMSFGNAIDLWIQILPDGTVDFQSKISGLGVWGLTGADASNGTFGATGPIPGGMRNTHPWVHQVRRIEGDVDSIFGWTYAGTLFLFNPMADATMSVEVDLVASNLYATGVSYPGVVARIDGVADGQFLTMNLQEYWEVVATERTRAIVKGPELAEPCLNPGFPNLMRALWRESDLPWFTNTDVNPTYMQKVAEVASMLTPSDMWQFFKRMNILNNTHAFMNLVEGNPLLQNHRLLMLMQQPEHRRLMQKRDRDDNRIYSVVDGDDDGVQADSMFGDGSIGRSIGQTLGDSLGKFTGIPGAAQIGSALGGALGEAGGNLFGQMGSLFGESMYGDGNMGQQIGSTIGGAVGSLIPLPGVAQLGSALGGVVGNLAGSLFSDGDFGMPNDNVELTAPQDPSAVLGGNLCVNGQMSADSTYFSNNVVGFYAGSPNEKDGFTVFLTPYIPLVYFSHRVKGPRSVNYAEQFMNLAPQSLSIIPVSHLWMKSGFPALEQAASLQEKMRDAYMKGKLYRNVQFKGFAVDQNHLVPTITDPVQTVKSKPPLDYVVVFYNGWVLSGDMVRKFHKHIIKMGKAYLDGGPDPIITPEMQHRFKFACDAYVERLIARVSFLRDNQGDTERAQRDLLSYILHQSNAIALMPSPAGTRKTYTATPMPSLKGTGKTSFEGRRQLIQQAYDDNAVQRARAQNSGWYNQQKGKRD